MKEISTSKYDLLARLDKRFFDYAKAISPAGDSSFTLTVVSHWNYFKEQLKTLDSQYDLYGKEFWGYGINKICDGKTNYSNLDVSEIARLAVANKHHDHSIFNLIIFKIQEDHFVYNTFSFNLLKLRWESNLLQKISLGDIRHVKPRIQNQSRYVEMECDNLSLPISFQVETYYSYNTAPETISKYYIDKISQLSQEFQKRNRKISHDFDKLDKSIDEIELKIRKIIDSELTKGLGFDSFRKVVPDNLKPKIEDRIKKWLRDHPGSSNDKFQSLHSTLQFFDLMEYKELIVTKLYWKSPKKFLFLLNVGSVKGRFKCRKNC